MSPRRALKRAAAIRIKLDSPHDRHNVIVRAHNHHLRSHCARLQREWWNVMADGESLRVIDHLAQEGGLRFTGDGDSVRQMSHMTTQT